MKTQKLLEVILVDDDITIDFNVKDIDTKTILKLVDIMAMLSCSILKTIINGSRVL